MNIFVLHDEPSLAARDHCDKHVVKMVLEYAQLMSTAHRVLDGFGTIVEWEEPVYETKTEFGGGQTDVCVGHRARSRRVLLLDGETATMEYSHVLLSDLRPRYALQIKNRQVMNATHANHPCAIWARASSGNYLWLFELWTELLAEYTRRYGKQHSSARFMTQLEKLPSVPCGPRTQFVQAMPPEFQVPNDPITAYHRFYVGPKSRFARWTNTPAPAWFVDGITTKEGRFDASRFERTR